MTVQNPQVFEGVLDQILAGTLTEPELLKSTLRALLVTRRRYNDPYQNGQANGAVLGRPNQSSTGPDRLGGVPFSNLWTVASQQARVEAGVTFLTPLVGAAVGSYPPITYPAGPNGSSGDSMGNIIPSGKP